MNVNSNVCVHDETRTPSNETRTLCHNTACTQTNLQPWRTCKTRVAGSSSFSLTTSKAKKSSYHRKESVKLHKKTQNRNGNMSNGQAVYTGRSEDVLERLSKWEARLRG